LEWFREWRRVLKLAAASVLVQLHGHKALLAWVEGGACAIIDRSVLVNLDLLP
jgi:hypothetical protein